MEVCFVLYVWFYRSKMFIFRGSWNIFVWKGSVFFLFISWKLLLDTLRHYNKDGNGSDVVEGVLKGEDHIDCLEMKTAGKLTNIMIGKKLKHNNIAK